MSEPSIIHFDDCEIDLAAYVLRRGGAPQPIEPQVFELLAYLARHPDRLITKDELIEQVWGGRIVSDAALSSRIKSARRALGDDGVQQRLIRTVHGRGIRFVGAIISDAPPAADAANAPDRRPSPTWHAITKRARALPAIGVAGISGVALAVAVVFASQVMQPPAAPPAQPAAETPHAATAPRLSIAVLPFANRSGDPGQDHLADALVDDITTALARERALRVMSGGSTQRYRGLSVDASTVGRELNVRYVAQGSMRREGDAAWINVQLVEAGSGQMLWTRSLDYQSADGFQAQIPIVAQITQVLVSEVVAAESRRSLRERPDNPDAEDLRTQGYALLNRRMTIQVTEQASQLFEAALALDGSSAAALIGLARVNLNRVANGWAPLDERAALLARADDALMRAIQLAPESGMAQGLRGELMRLRGDPEQAVAAFERALELNPYAPGPHASLGRVKIDVGRAAESIGHIEQAIRLSPHDRVAAIWYFWAGQAAVHVGDGATAAAWLRKAIEANPSFANPQAWLAVAHVLMDRAEDGRRPMEDFLRAHPGLTISTWDGAYQRRHPVVLAQRERIHAALRLLGVPE